MERSFAVVYSEDQKGDVLADLIKRALDDCLLLNINARMVILWANLQV